NSCVFNVRVEDHEDPRLECPSKIVTTTTGGCDQAVNWTAMATDNCAVTNVACLPASGSTFALGNTIVTCTAWDSSGNHASCSFTIVVEDHEDPVLSCPANVSTNTTGSCAQIVNWPAPEST